MNDKIKIIVGRSNEALGNEILTKLRLEKVNVDISPFKDGEICIKIDESIRGTDVFVIQSTCRSVNDNLMELLLLIDALKRASAGRITAVIPYFGYARQDKKDRPRVPISARLVADLLQTAGADRILTMDLHAGQIQGFFTIPLDQLSAAPVLINEIKKENIPDPVIVSPDSGGVKRAKIFADRLGCEMAVVIKEHDPEKKNVSIAEALVGDVKNKNAIIVDDIIDSGGTLKNAAELLNGVKGIYVAASHGIFSDPAFNIIKEKKFKKVFVTNSIPINVPEDLKNVIKVSSIAKLFANAIKNIHNDNSVSELLTKF